LKGTEDTESLVLVAAEGRAAALDANFNARRGATMSGASSSLMDEGQGGI